MSVPLLFLTSSSSRAESRLIRRLSTIAFLAAAMPHAASAQTPEAPAEEVTQSGEQAHELDAIVVEDRLVEPTGSEPSTGTTLDEEALEEFERDDVHQVLLQVPGVQVRGEDGFGLRPNIGLRGTSPERSTKVTLMEDGVLFGPAPYAAPAAYYFPMVTRMTAVEVFKGGSQIRFGPNALGGAINFETADIPARDWEGFVDVAGGQFGYFKAHGRGGYASERMGYLLEALHTQSEGFKQLDGGGNTGFDKNEVMAKWRYNSDPLAAVYQQLDVKLGLSTETSNETYLGLTDTDFRATPYRRYAASQLDQMRWQRGQAVVSYTVLPDDVWELQATAYHHRFVRDWFKFNGFAGTNVSDVLDSPDALRNRIFYDILVGEADSSSEAELIEIGDNYRWYISQGLQNTARAQFETGAWTHRFEVGLRFHYDEVNRRHTDFFYAMRSGGLEEAGLAPESTTQNRGQAYAMAAHVLDEISYRKLTLTPGVRMEAVWTEFNDFLAPQRSNQRSQIGILPGMGAHLQLTDQLGVLGGAYRGFSPVPPQPLAPGQPRPSPEESLNFEAGMRYSRDVAFLELVGFFNDYENLTAVCSESRGCDPDDVGNQFDGGAVNVYGLESLAAARWQINSWTFPVRATYTLTFSEFLSDFQSSNPEWGDVSAGDELAYLPRHQASLTLGAQYSDRWALSANATYVGPTREIAGQGEIPRELRTDPYGLVGLVGRYRVWGPLWLYGKLQNVLDQDYLASRRPLGARPGAPFSAQLGLKAELPEGLGDHAAP